MTSKIQSFWDKHAETYDNTDRKFRPVSDKALPKTKAYLTTEDMVLDFGCATGAKTMELAPATRHIHGLDYSLGMIRVASQIKDRAGIPNCSFSHGTIFGDELKTTSFNKILTFGVIHLLHEPEKVVARIHDLLTPGGLFITMTPCLKERMSLKMKIEFSAFMMITRLGFLPLELTTYTIKDIEHLLHGAGFELVESDSIFHGATFGFVVGRKRT
jgi:2-polyprenyl-3-methyl-5-hydroxy-6-metoxy-1,4-benzoquinol methylase